jgi:purine-binding chemotaxis protein CheW
MSSTQPFETMHAADASLNLGASAGADQYLTFLMGEEEYGVDILRVQEIKGWEKATPVPNTPPYIKGVMNLRGTIVPVIDLRLRFGMQPIEYGPMTVVIVLRVEHESGSRVMGVVVDAVSDVYNVPEKEMKSAPDFGTSIDTAYIKGLATLGEKMVIVLDIDHLLNADQMASVAAVAKAPPLSKADVADSDAE